MSVKDFRREMEKRLVERANALAEQLCAGNVPNMDQYKYLTGQIRALRDVELWLEASEKAALGQNED
jgi:hypothetical protein